MPKRQRTTYGGETSAAGAARGQRKYLKVRSHYAAPLGAQLTGRYTKGLVYDSGEKKGLDTFINHEDGVSKTPSTTNTNDFIFPLNLVRPGTASYNRVGRKIKMHSLRCLGVIESNVTGHATTGDYLEQINRVCVVYDRQPNGAIPVFSDIFSYTEQDGTEGSDIYTLPAYDNMQRFRILKDIVFAQDIDAYNGASGTTDLMVQRKIIDFYLPLKGLETTYSGQSSPCTIADISTGALYIVFRAYNNLAASYSLVENFTCRLRYFD